MDWIVVVYYKYYQFCGFEPSDGIEKCQSLRWMIKSTTLTFFHTHKVNGPASAGKVHSLCVVYQKSASAADENCRVIFSAIFLDGGRLTLVVGF